MLNCVWIACDSQSFGFCQAEGVPRINVINVEIDAIVQKEKMFLISSFLGYNQISEKIKQEKIIATPLILTNKIKPKNTPDNKI